MPPPRGPAGTVSRTDAVTAMQDEVRALAQERHALVLAHDYQVPAVQEVANVLGDSLTLLHAAADSDADTIAICALRTLAESTAVLCPDKVVLLPDVAAGHALGTTITAEQLRNWKTHHPDAVVVMYVNTPLDVKAEADYCCTSTNAVAIAEHVWHERGPDTKLLFGPGTWLGTYVERRTGRFMHVWPGEHRLREEPRHVPIKGAAGGQYMKLITLPVLRDALRPGAAEVHVPPDVAAAARPPLERMMAIA